MPDLTVTLIQTELVWEEIQANLKRFQAEIDAMASPTDLVILPEMLSTGFSMGAEALAEEMDGAAVTWMRNTAVEKNTVITGSVMIKDKGRFFNRLIWARPDGTMETYDKKHLFRYAGEEKVYTPGQRRITVELNGWKIRPFICYDLRFPIWTRNLDNAYDLAIFVANWPTRRAHHWRALLPARAIENQAYVAAVNRVGKDGNGIAYRGDSAVIDPLGRVLFEKADDACAATLTLSRNVLADYRRQFPAWMDADIDMAAG
jgi:predicted amidohydrolase